MKKLFASKGLDFAFDETSSMNMVVLPPLIASCIAFMEKPLPAALALALSLWALPADALTNGGFETGTPNGWGYAGDTSVQSAASLGVTPAQGNYAALMFISETGSYAPPGGGSGDLMGWLGTDWYGLMQWELAHQDLAPCSLPDYGVGLDQCSLIAFGATGAAYLHQQVFLREGEAITYQYKRVGDFLDHSFALFAPVGAPFFNTVYQYTDLAGAFADYTEPNTQEPWIGGFPGPKEFFTDKATPWARGSFIAPQTGAYSLLFGNLGRFDTGWNSGLWVDDVKISQAPEPGSLALLGLGLAGLAFTRRRKP